MIEIRLQVLNDEAGTPGLWVVGYDAEKGRGARTQVLDAQPARASTPEALCEVLSHRIAHAWKVVEHAMAADSGPGH